MAAPAAQIPVWSPEGDLGYMPAEQFDQGAVMQGYRQATPQEVTSWQAEQKYGSPLETAKAAGEGALSALTFGAGPKIEQAFGAKQEDIAGRKEAHPIAHAAGEMGGVAAGLLVPGGQFTAPGAIAKAGRGAAEAVGAAKMAGVAGRVLPAVASAATEGALYGGEDVVERHFLGDPNLTAEKAIAEIGLSALIPGALVGGGKLIGEALRPLGDKLIAKGAQAAETKALLEVEKEEASLSGAMRERTANAYRQMERVELALNNPALPAEERASLLEFKASPEYADLVKANAKSVLENAPEALAEREGARGVLEEFKTGKDELLAEKAASMQDPTRLGDLVNERIIKRYGSRAALGWLFGTLSGAGGPIGTLGGISYGYMKDVIKRIVRDPAMFATVGRLIKSPLETFSAMAGLGRLTHSTDQAIASGVGAIFGSGAAAGGAEAAAHAVTPGNYTHVAGNLSGYSGNLDKLAEDTGQQTAPLRTHAPATTDALHGIAARGVQTLAGKLPAPGQRQPLDPPYQPSRAELVAYNRYHEIAESPARVLQHVAAGTITREHMDALQTIYPNLASEMRQKVMDRLAAEVSKGTRLPHQKRLALSLFLGSDLDSSSTQHHLAATQAAFAQHQQQAAPRPSAAGLSRLSVASRLSTPMQASAARKEA